MGAATGPKPTPAGQQAPARLTEDNPGGTFTALVADLTALHTDLFGAQATADAGLNQRSTAAQQQWGALADLQHQLEEDEELLRYKAKKLPQAPEAAPAPTPTNG